jgi:hypothetical protein
MRKRRKRVIVKKSNYSLVLSRVLQQLREKKVGKQLTKDFENFVHAYEDTKKSFHLTFPETSDILESE